MRTRQKQALFVRTNVHRVIDEVFSDSAVVQKRVSLCRRSVRGNRFAPPLRINQKCQEPSLGFANLLFQIQICFQTVHAGCAFPVSHLGKPLAPHDWLACTRVANVQTQRTAMGRKLIDIENSKPKLSKHFVKRKQREIRKMFVIDRIELTPFHQPQEMRDFNRDSSARLQQQFQSANEIIEVGTIRQNIVRNDKIRLLSAGAKLHGNPGAKKLGQGGYSLFLCDLGDVSRRLESEHRNSLSLEILQQIAVVARYFNNQALCAQSK